jgi:hypothetical protein
VNQIPPNTSRSGTHQGWYRTPEMAATILPITVMVIVLLKDVKDVINDFGYQKYPPLKYIDILHESLSFVDSIIVYMYSI